MRIVLTRAATAAVCALLALPATAQSDEPYGEAAPAQSVKRRAPKGKGAIWGVVRDAATKEPIADTVVEALGTDQVVITDAQGQYRLELAPGKYTLRYESDSHVPLRAKKVQVWAGGVRRINAALELDQQGSEEYVVELEPEIGDSVEDLTLRRQKASAVGDAVGRSEISKNADNNAAQAAQRVVGATIIGGRFVYVRGLGERYTNALLNGAPLPSPEPDRAAVPLDLFPTSVLESLTIVKTFTPDVPGDFAGGSVRVETRRVPRKFLFNASLSLGLNTQSTFRERLSYRGGGLDFLGFDDGTRAAPSGVPDYKLARAVEKPNGEFVLDPELQKWGREFNTFMSGVRRFTPPNHRASVVVGDGFKLGGESRIGYVASVNYSRNFQIREGITRNFEANPSMPNGISVLQDLGFERGIDSVRWGAFGSVMFEVNPKHRLNLIGFRSQLSDNEVFALNGFYDSQQTAVQSTRLRFTERALNVLQLHGHHDLDELNKAKVKWNLSYSVAQRSEPNTRDVVYRLNPGTSSYTYVDGSESGRHFFSDQDEKAFGGGLDFTQPLTSDPEVFSLKAGGLASVKNRTFRARRFSLRRQAAPADPSVFDCAGTTYDQSCPDKLFVPGNIGPNLTLEENTQDTDAYDAGLSVFAGYLMARSKPVSDVELTGGARVEVTDQSLDPVDQFDSGVQLTGASLESTDWLPAGSVTYSATKKAKLRAAYSRTLARPQLRELAPFAYSDFFGGRLTSGNPDLTITRIHNLDARFEFFPTLAEVLAFSVFYKGFQDPIEPVIKPSGDSGLITFQNADSANLIGVELEARVSLGRITPAASDFGIVSNITLARSRIEVRQTDVAFLTNLSRPMVNQAPVVANAGLDFNRDEIGLRSRLTYNVSGKRIVSVGAEGLDDSYQHPFHRVDFNVSKRWGEHFTLKFKARNLLDPDQLVTIGSAPNEPNATLRYKEGRSFSIGASYAY